jgi:hypothetical protein
MVAVHVYAGEEGTGDGTHRDENNWPHAGQERAEVDGGAGEGFIGGGIGVVGGRAPYRICYADLSRSEASEGEVGLAEFLAGVADEWHSLCILVVRWPLAEEEDAAGGGAGGEDWAADAGAKGADGLHFNRKYRAVLLLLAQGRSKSSQQTNGRL